MFRVQPFCWVVGSLVCYYLFRATWGLPVRVHAEACVTFGKKIVNLQPYENKQFISMVFCSDFSFEL